MSIYDFSKELPIGKWIYLPKTEDTEEFLSNKTDELFNNPRTRHGRSYSQVYNSVKMMLIEHTLVKYNPDFILNPKRINISDPESYAYDVVHKPSGMTVEIKRFGLSDNFKWFSYPKQALKTFLKNIDIIDTLACAKFKEETNRYAVKFMLVADTKTFKEYMKTSVYNSDDMYYSHYNAAKNGDCVFNI